MISTVRCRVASCFNRAAETLGEVEVDDEVFAEDGAHGAPKVLHGDFPNGMNVYVLC